MDVLICEDDPVARSVISDLVEDLGGQVLAGVDSTLDALAFLSRFTPDVAVVDLLLHRSNGIELVERLRRDHPDVTVVVFTAHDSLLHIDDAVEVVAKPDFERLARVLAAASERHGERRRPVRPVPAQPATVDSHAFYRLVADARPDDVLLCVTLDDGADPDAVVTELRTALRTHDLVLRRNRSVVALLVGGGEETVRALEQRVRATLPHLADRTTSTVVGDQPIDAFSRLTTG